MLVHLLAGVTGHKFAQGGERVIKAEELLGQGHFVKGAVLIELAVEAIERGKVGSTRLEDLHHLFLSFTALQS